MILNIHELNFGCGLSPKVLYVKNGEGQTHIVYDAFIKTLTVILFSQNPLVKVRISAAMSTKAKTNK